MAEPTLGPIEVMPSCACSCDPSGSFSTVGNCQHDLQSLQELVPLGMSSPKPPDRGRVLGVGKAGWAHLRPESGTQVCSAERPLWGLGPSEMTAAPRGAPGDTVPGREGFPPCQIRWAGSCQPLSAGLRSTDESLQVSQAPPPPALWPASWVARGSESIS